MNDPVAFINARLDEDEAAARAWLPLGNPTAAQREHIARQDPRRMLREVEAKRAILDWHNRQCTCSWCTADGDDLEEPDFAPACPTICLLAAVWSDHPDYRQEWALS